MSVNYEQLLTILNATPYSVFRDLAPKNTTYPYVVYSFISKDRKVAGGGMYRRLITYQISLFTTGIEKDLEPIEKIFEKNHLPFTPWMSTQGDENDDTVTNFFTQVKVIEDE